MSFMSWSLDPHGIFVHIYIYIPRAPLLTSIFEGQALKTRLKFQAKQRLFEF